MKRYDPKIVLALSIALAAHLLVLGIGEHAARRGLGGWLYRAPSAQAATIKPLFVIPPKEDPQDLGEANGVGRSINSAPGNQELESAFADPRQDQAMMTNGPVGMSDLGSAQSLASALRGENGDGRPRAGDASSNATPGRLFAMIDAEQASPKTDQSLIARLVHSQGKPAPIPPANSHDDAPLTDRPEMTNPDAPGTAAPRPTAHDDQGGVAAAVVGDASGTNQLTSSAQSKASAQPTAPPQNAAATPTNAAASNSDQKNQNQANSGTGRAGPVDTKAGKPMPSSDFESFPVTKVAIQYLPGRILSRSGRKFLARRLPDLTLAAWDDASRLGHPAVVLRLEINADGNVTEVKTIQSSGSKNIDLPCERAAINWWFEPLIDPQTHQPRAEVMEFTINF